MIFLDLLLGIKIPPKNVIELTVSHIKEDIKIKIDIALLYATAGCEQ